MVKFLKTFKNYVFWWKNMVGFFKKKFWFFYKNAECSKLAVKCDWKSKTSCNLQKLGIVKKIYGFFEKKIWFCRNRQKLKILLLDATEIVRLLKTLKNCFLLEKKDWFFKKKSWVFSETAKSIVQFDAECNWISKFSQNVQKFCFFWKNRDWYFEKFLLFLKSLKVAKLHYKATGKGRILKAFQKLVFFLKKWMGFSEKKYPIFQETDKGSKFAVECDWISNISQHVRKLRFRKQDGYSEKNFEVLKNR